MDSVNDSLSRVRDFAEMHAIFAVEVSFFFEGVFIPLRLLHDHAHAFAKKPLFQTLSGFHLALIQLFDADDALFI